MTVDHNFNLSKHKINFAVQCIKSIDDMHIPCRGRHGRDRMIVGFTTTYAISAYHH